MPTSAAGNKPPLPAQRSARLQCRTRGFTLIELMVVVALIAVATAGVTLSLRDSALDALERDAQRLAAQLEAARAQARASGVAVLWLAQADGHRFQGLPRPGPTQPWLSAQTRVVPGPAIVLGPEPLIPPRQITLYSASASGTRVQVSSDGLRPFTVHREPAAGRP